MNVFDINFNSTAQIKWLGEREVPLLIIDDLYTNPSQVREFAFNRSFPESQAYYPGRHQPIANNDDGIANLMSFLSRVLSQATNRTIKRESLSTDFSVITTSEKMLLAGQGNPHIDATPMLGVIYLNEADFGGTVFFRNKITGAMSVITDEQKKHYELTMKNGQANGDKRYVVDSEGDWEKVETIEGKMNRLVIWPGNVWHSVEIKVPPEKGKLSDKRLTQRIIVNHVE